LLEKKLYANGKKTFDIEKDVLTYYFKNGKIKAQGHLKNQKMQGEWRFYRESGQLWQVGHFIDNEKNGSWIRYDKNDKVEYSKDFKDNKVVKESKK
jgi:antitoxin component YwqK of YwqJK toxin-antitoxin module